MLPDKRALIAFICATRMISKKINHIYDCTRNKYCFYISNNQNSNHISIFDCGTGHPIIGRLPQLFDFASQNLLFIDIKTDRAQGIDYKTNTFFSVKITGKMIILLDFAENNYFNYSI